MERIASRVELAERCFAGEGAELGVWLGDFSAVLLRCCERVHLVDLYGPMPAYWSPVSEVALLSMQVRFSAELAAGRAVFHRAESIAWLQSWPRLSLDWVYIDTSHSFMQTRIELEAARWVVRPGGWLAGHDYCGLWPGVGSAVDEFTAVHGLRVALMTNEPEFDVDLSAPWLRPWMPTRCAYNSFAIQLPE